MFIVINSITFVYVGPTAPPIITPLVELEQDAKWFVLAFKLPKSIASPVDAIVTN